METEDGEGVPQEVDEEVVNQSQVLEEAPTSEESPMMRVTLKVLKPIYHPLVLK